MLKNVVLHSLATAFANMVWNRKKRKSDKKKTEPVNIWRLGSFCSLARRRPIPRTVYAKIYPSSALMHEKDLCPSSQFPLSLHVESQEEESPILQDNSWESRERREPCQSPGARTVKSPSMVSTGPWSICNDYEKSDGKNLAARHHQKGSFLFQFSVFFTIREDRDLKNLADHAPNTNSLPEEP